MKNPPMIPGTIIQDMIRIILMDTPAPEASWKPIADGDAFEERASSDFPLIPPNPTS